MKYYTISEVAKMLNYTVQAIYYRTKLKPGHHLYIKTEELASGVYLIPQEEVERLKDERDIRKH